MSARVTAFAFALLAIALTLAQDALPARDWYHAWQYVTILAIAIVVMAAHAWTSWRGRNGPHGRRFALALTGAIVVAVAGLLSGLIGPDTVTVIGTPGTVTPVPDAGVAAFFSTVDPAALERGDATVTIRRRGAPQIDVGPRPAPFGLWVAFTQSRPAAYVVVRNQRGDRLTVTQPSNPSFLSPVMLFRQSQEIHDQTFPLDTFAVPGVDRVFRILYFSPADLAAFRHQPVAPDAKPGAILTASDEAGKQYGITMAASGEETPIAGVRVTVTLGSYPVLLIASAPQPLAVIAGLALFAGAGAFSMTTLRRPVRASVPDLERC